MEQPFFSVIIPTYNAGSMLKKAVESVLGQTFTDFELLVIDNHSTDDSEDYLNSIGDPRVICHKVHNQGKVAVSRNCGGQLASGTWLAFLDADDEWYAGKLQKVYEVVDARPDLSLICHSMDLVSGSKHIRAVPRFSIEGDFFHTLYTHGNPILLSSSVVKREVFDEAGGFSEDSHYATVEDLELWMRLAVRGQFYSIPDSLGVYNLHENNTSKKRAEQQAAALLLLLEPSINQQENSQYSFLKKRYFLSRARADAARILLKAGHFAQAAAFGRKGVLLWPIYWKNWAVISLCALRIAR